MPDHTYRTRVKGLRIVTINPQILTIVTGISGLLGLLGLMTYLYHQLQISRAERSVREIVEGEGLFKADQVVEILKIFDNDTARLEALRDLTHHDGEKAKSILTKVKSNVDVEQLVNISSRNYKNISGMTAITFTALALIGLLFIIFKPESSIPGKSTARTPTSASIRGASLTSYQIEYYSANELQKTGQSTGNLSDDTDSVIVLPDNVTRFVLKITDSNGKNYIFTSSGTNDLIRVDYDEGHKIIKIGKKKSVSDRSSFVECAVTSLFHFGDTSTNCGNN